MLRHIVATIAYRGAKVLRGAPAGFDRFHSAQGTRTPGEILAHICDLFDWAMAFINGKEKWQSTSPAGWKEDTARFFSALQAVDAALAEGRALDSPERLFQGPFADALTHIGQLAMLRRMAGSPVRGENYYRAQIASGRVGPDQPPGIIEFE